MAKCKTFTELWERSMRYEREQRRRAGKHKCVAIEVGTWSRVIGASGKILKRPVVLGRFYECSICGRDMTPKDKED